MNNPASKSAPLYPRMEVLGSIQLGISPKEADVALAPIDPYGTPGELNKMVIEMFSYSLTDLPGERDLAKGFHLLRLEEKQPILFVVTTEYNKPANENLKKNLYNALDRYAENLSSRKVWVPIMSTGEGGLSFEDSYTITVSILNSLREKFIGTEFLIALPNDKRGQTFYTTLSEKRTTPSIPQELLNNANFWWLNAYPIEVPDLTIGSYVEYRTHDSVGGTALADFDLFLQAKENELIIIYESEPTRGLKAIGRISRTPKSKIGDLIEVEILYVIHPEKGSWDRLVEIPSFSRTEIARNNKINFFKLSKPEFLDIAAAAGLNLDRSDDAPAQEQTIDQPETDDKAADKIPFHLDQVEVTDRLNREPIAKSLARLLNNEIFKPGKTLDFSFMIHLQGAWGDGKSTFLNLLKKNLKTPETKWIVIDFNAWQNQHIFPPWWSFLDKIYRQSLKDITWYARIWLWLRESFRRAILSKIVTFSLAVLFGYLIYSHRNEIFNFANHFIEDKPADKESSLSMEIIARVTTAFVSFIGLLYTVAKFFTHPFFLSSPDDAKTFMNRASDPMRKIKDHFKNLISDLNLFRYNVAIFIDDLDRCNADFTVGLLEGIQTLFKDKGVLYVVAGDRHWISTCFENHYEKYKDVAKEPAQRLGYLFLEKAFQLSLRLPNISASAKKDYWNFILNPANGKAGIKPLSKKEEEERTKKNARIKEEITQDYNQTDLINPEKIKEIVDKNDLDEKEITDIVLEVVDESHDDIQHLLLNNHDLIDTNPRSIKRLANQYTIYRNILMVEGKKFERDKLFRWLVLQNKYPVFTDWIEKNLLELQTGAVLNTELQILLGDLKWKQLMMDEENQNGGKIEAEDISIFTGIGLNKTKMKPMPLKNI